MSEEKKRMRVVFVEVKVTYEDGFTTTLSSPPMISIRRSDLALSGPGLPQKHIKEINRSAMEQTAEILEGVLKDVRDSIPTEEEVQRAQNAAMEELARQQASQLTK
jgi:hypothetical protein